MRNTTKPDGWGLCIHVRPPQCGLVDREMLTGIERPDMYAGGVAGCGWGQISVIRVGSIELPCSICRSILSPGKATGGLRCHIIYLGFIHQFRLVWFWWGIIQDLLKTPPMPYSFKYSIISNHATVTTFIHYIIGYSWPQNLAGNNLKISLKHSRQGPL